MIPKKNLGFNLKSRLGVSVSQPLGQHSGVQVCISKRGHVCLEFVDDCIHLCLCVDVRLTMKHMCMRSYTCVVQHYWTEQSVWIGCDSMRAGRSRPQRLTHINRFLHGWGWWLYGFWRGPWGARHPKCYEWYLGKITFPNTILHFCHCYSS